MSATDLSMQSESVGPFRLERRVLREDWLELQILGELDVSVVEEFRSGLDESIAEQMNLALNLEACQFLDCAGLAEILAARRRIREVGQDLCLSAISPAAQRLFELTGVLGTNLMLEVPTGRRGAAFR